MKIKQMMLLLFILILLTLRCDLTDLPVNTSFVLTLEDVSCTEAWIKVSGAAGSEIQLNRDGKEVKRFTLNASSLVVVDDSLLPNKTYVYQAIRNGEASNKVVVTTLDTTSHNFSWQTFTFGDQTSVLGDVFIIDENNIWAVGEIYLNDSTGQADPNFYNLIKWDGSQWKPERVYFKNSQGQSFLAPMKSIFVFNENDIWIGLDQIIHWNGSTYRSIELSDAVFESWINRIWGSSSSDLYIVGNGGNIAHYDGTSWQKLESETETNLLDIYGEGENVFIAGYEDFKPSVLLRYKDGKLTKVVEESPINYNPNRISGGIKSVWVKRKHLFTLSWYDLFRSSVDTDGKAESFWGGNPEQWGSNMVRGTDVNDMFTAGYNGHLWHYNGLSWKLYEEINITEDRLLSLSVKGNIVAAVGYRYMNGIENYGVIHIGRR